MRKARKLDSEAANSEAVYTQAFIDEAREPLPAIMRSARSLTQNTNIRSAPDTLNVRSWPPTDPQIMKE